MLIIGESGARHQFIDQPCPLIRAGVVEKSERFFNRRSGADDIHVQAPDESFVIADFAGWFRGGIDGVGRWVRCGRGACGRFPDLVQ